MLPGKRLDIDRKKEREAKEIWTFGPGVWDDGNTNRIRELRSISIWGWIHVLKWGIYIYSFNKHLWYLVNVPETKLSARDKMLSRDRLESIEEDSWTVW